MTWWYCRGCVWILRNDLLADCSMLTPYVTQARYPNTEEITEPETASALHKAERIVNYCASLITPASPVDTSAEKSDG